MFLKVAAAATVAVAGGLYALMSSPSQQAPFEARARRDDEEDDNDAPSLQIRWTKPEPGWVKLNVDGSHDHISYPPSSGCGGVMRDSSGAWLFGFAQKLDPSCEVHVTKIEAILKGMELAWEMNVKKLVVESDRDSAVSMVENGFGRKFNHEQYNIINRIRQLCFDPKWEVKVVHVPRKANRVANRLARDARNLSSEDLCKYLYPPANCKTLIQEDSQGGDNDGGWGSMLLKVASAAAATVTVADGLYAHLSTSSQQSPFEARARRVIKGPDDEEDDNEAPSLQIRWTKPEPGWVKLNVDGSHDHISYPPSSGCGGVMRDASGTWLLGFAQKLDPSCEVHVTEIEAILKGMELAWEMNVKKLVVESDLESAVSMVEKGVRVNHPQYTIISRIRQLLSDPKWEVKVVHIPREANRVANKLARDARNLFSENLRKYPYPPASCETLIQEDSLGGAWAINSPSVTK